jgi:restriction system protein
MLGAKNAFATEAHAGSFIGADYDIGGDLTDKLPDNWREFNKEYIPKWLKTNEGKSKVAAGLACGMLWTITKGLIPGDIVLSPDGNGNYLVGEIEGVYYYAPGQILQHRRRVRWIKSIAKSETSQELQNSAGSIGTVSNLTKYADELSALIDTSNIRKTLNDESIEDPSVFALEKHLEDFLVHNWRHTELGKKYDIYEVDGEVIGQQYLSDTGPLDILAISKDKKELLVVELKRGRASDAVVGQIQRYMGFVKEVLLDKGQIVKGVIIAFEDDIRIHRALSVTDNIDFYTYKISFKLEKR